MRADAFLFTIAVIALLVLGGLLALSIMSTKPSGGGLSYIVVTASGAAYATPQNATVYVAMNGTGATAAIATANLSLVLSEFNYTVLKYIGGNQSLITTQSYTLYRTHNSSSYTAAEYVSVSVPQIDNVSQLIGALSTLHDTYVSGVTSELSARQASQLTDNALALALQNATSQAQTLAEGAAVVARNITTGSRYMFPAVGYPYAGAVAQGGTVNPIFYSGREGVTEQVTVQFSYK